MYCINCTLYRATVEFILLFVERLLYYCTACTATAVFIVLYVDRMLNLLHCM